MRRLGGIVVCVALVGWLAGAAAADSGGHGSSTLPVPLALHESWIHWAFGGPTAPLLNSDLCGEMVGHVFYMTVAGNVPNSVTRHLDCDVPKGVPILVTPGGGIAWAPTYGKTDQQLRRSLFGADGVQSLISKSVHVSLDGHEVDHGPLVAPDPYDLSLEPGNLIEAVDPGVTGDSTRIAEAWYFTLFRGFGPGTHTIVASDKYRYHPTVRYRSIFTVHVH